VKIDMPGVPEVTVRAVDMEWKMTESASTADSLLGYYFKEVNQLSEKYGKLTGGIMYRVVYRMFDGSYVLHTLPRFLCLGMEVKAHNAAGNSRLSFSASNIEVSVFKEHFRNINTDIFTDVMVFACKNESIYNISKDTIDENFIDTMEEKIEWGIDGAESLSFVMSVMNEDFKNMHDAKAWYKIYEKKIKDIQDISGIFVSENADTKGFYQDYATRETLPVDQFSHHKLSGQVAYTYNDRLLLGDISTRFGQYTACLNTLYIDDANWIQKWRGIISDTFQEYGLSDYAVVTLENVSQMTGTIAFEFTLSVQGKKITITKQADNQSFYYDAEKYCFILPEVLGYPDTRATQMRLLYYDSTNTRWIEVGKYNLRASKNDNYAYYCENITINADPGTTGYTTNPQTAGKYIVAELTLSEMGNKVTTLSTQENLIDSNRVQASELQNPLFFPSKYSYQVGTGEVLGIAANTEPLSTGQFGEYPLSVFTSKGIWTMLQGSGDVLFASIQPLNGEVVKNKEQIVPLSVGVTYTTEKGLYLISGRNVKDLTEVSTGPVNAEIKANTDFLKKINNNQLVQIVNYLSNVSIEQYLTGARIGFDKANEEIAVTNNSYNYSYVYNLQSGYWYKLSNAFKLFVNSYPDLKAVCNKTGLEGIFSISQESFVNNFTVLLVTRPCKLSGQDDYKIIDRIIQRCELHVPETYYSGFYVFASNDLRKWQLLQRVYKTGNNLTDLLTGRSFVKAKYFIFMFASVLTGDNSINDIEIEYYRKLSNKLR
jgi:hypothetical protein